MSFSRNNWLQVLVIFYVWHYLNYDSQFRSVVSSVPQGSILLPLLFILYTADLENEIILYADDTTLYAEVVPPSNCLNVIDFLNIDLTEVHSWCSMYIRNETHSIIISRSRISLLLHPPLTICGVDLEVFNSLNPLLEIMTNLFYSFF